MLILEKNFGTKQENHSFFQKEMNYVLYYSSRANFFSIFKHDLMLKPDELITEIFNYLVFPHFESYDYGIICEEKTEKRTLEDALKIAYSCLSDEIDHITRNYKRYPHILNFIRKQRGIKYLSVEDFKQYQKTISMVKDVFSSFDKTFTELKNRKPEIFPENFLNQFNKTVSNNPFEIGKGMNLFAISFNHIPDIKNGKAPFVVQEYVVEDAYLRENHNKETKDTFQFTYAYDLKSIDKGNASYSLNAELNQYNGVKGMYLTAGKDSVILFTDKEQLKKYINNLHSLNKNVIDNI